MHECDINTHDMSWVDNMNVLSSKHIPFFFMLDFELKSPFIQPLSTLNNDQILYKVNNRKNYIKPPLKPKTLYFDKKPMPSSEYKIQFDKVIKEINYGNSFLLNLTFPTEINTNYSLIDIFYRAHAKYKLHVDGKFTVFSPETFVNIIGDKIYTYPMKGTIDAAIPHARKIILDDYKEKSEHYTIVDLLRNDLSKISHQVTLEKFRYIEKINANNKALLQVSSSIKGTLKNTFKGKLGSIFLNILPAGSISGAPKKQTVQIIKENELDERGFYTGVFGIFDGKNLESAVMIRYIEQKSDKLIYRSGCGITSLSQWDKEYTEMLDKIYVPFS